ARDLEDARVPPDPRAAAQEHRAGRGGRRRPLPRLSPLARDHRRGHPRGRRLPRDGHVRALTSSLVRLPAALLALIVLSTPARGEVAQLGRSGPPKKPPAAQPNPEALPEGEIRVRAGNQ